MSGSSRLRAVAFMAVGLALFVWLVHDATSVQRALGLQDLVSEGTVALSGLALAGGAMGAGWALWRQGRKPDAAGPAL